MQPNLGYKHSEIFQGNGKLKDLDNLIPEQKKWIVTVMRKKVLYLANKKTKDGEKYPFNKQNRTIFFAVHIQNSIYMSRFVGTSPYSFIKKTPLLLKTCGGFILPKICSQL